MKNIFLSRYSEDQLASSHLNHLDDALDIVTFLTAEEFVAKQLQDRHNKSRSNSVALAKRIAAHAKLAGQYARLSLSSPPEISFLPGYYAILNMAKIYSLAGPYSGEFNRHARWHGATYDSQNKSSHSLLTEVIRIRAGGALALFYKTLTNNAITSDRVLKLKDIYPLVPGISSEVGIVTGKQRHPWVVMFRAAISGGTISVEADVLKRDRNGRITPYTGNVRTMPCLKGFRKKPRSKNTFTVSGASPAGLPLEEAARAFVNTEYLWFREPNNYDTCYEQSAAFSFPEEFASALAFFHMSSVCRYNPEFLDKLSKSKAWPMLLAVRRHTLFHFLISTWSFVTQRNYILTSD